jgi:hypothetical protein
VVQWSSGAVVPVVADWQRCTPGGGWEAPGDDVDSTRLGTWGLADRAQEDMGAVPVLDPAP